MLETRSEVLARTLGLKAAGNGTLPPKYSVCICTHRRYDELKRAVQSVVDNEYDRWELIVSDEGDEEVARYVRGFGDPRVRYVPGPKRGLGANRKNVVRYTRGYYLLFMDDDAVMDKRFLVNIDAVVRENSGAVITGYEKRLNATIMPPAFDFLGYMTKVGDLNNLDMVVLNAAVFPKEVFAVVAFDEQLTFGYDEADIIAQIKSRAGRRVVFCSNAFNYHFPSRQRRVNQRRFTEAARLYVTSKKYFVLQKRYLAGLLYAVIAPLHLLASSAWRAINRRDTGMFADVFYIVRSWVTYWLKKPRTAKPEDEFFTSEFNGSAQA